MPGTLFRSHFLLKLAAIERLRFSALFPFDQSGADCPNISLSGLIASDQIAEILAIVREPACGNLCLNPAILLLCARDCLPCRTHQTASKG